jgi:NAD(P)H-dependent FMN reductase
MRIVALNASPRGWLGDTHRMIDPFLRSAQHSGATVRRYVVRELRIEPCNDCGACEVTQQCRIDDDMRRLLGEIAEAETLVLAFPLFFGAAPGPLKTIVDRMRPLLSPESSGASRKRRRTFGPQSVVMVAVSTSWDRGRFEPVCSWFRAVADELSAEVSGMLLRPHATAWSAMSEDDALALSITEALEDAGRELVLDGLVAPESEAIVAAPLIDHDSFVAFLSAVRAHAGQCTTEAVR